MPMHRWADLSEPDYGVSLINVGKYGYNVHGNVLGLSLLRSPIYPDPYADEGEHEFVYAIYPHRGTWRNGTVQAARHLHSPLRFTKVGRSRPVHPSLLRIHGDPVELAALKKAEDSDDIILRLYEPHGSRVTYYDRNGRTPAKCASLVNILENSDELLVVEDERRINLSSSPLSSDLLEVGVRWLRRKIWQSLRAANFQLVSSVPKGIWFQSALEVGAQKGQESAGHLFFVHFRSSAPFSLDVSA